MKNILIILAVLVLVGGGAYYFLKSQNKASSNSATTANVATGPNTVLIKNFAFDPGTLNVKVGTTVTWINEDAATHTIKSNTFNSSDLGQGDKFTFTFNSAGTYNYSCGIHPTMTGQIIVNQ